MRQGASEGACRGYLGRVLSIGDAARRTPLTSRNRFKSRRQCAAKRPTNSPGAEFVGQEFDYEVGGVNVKYMIEIRTAPAVKLPPEPVRTRVVVE